MVFRKSGAGIVEKMGATYIRSHPDLIKDLDHGDRVFCFEIEHFKNYLDEITDSMKKSNLFVLDLLEEFILLENEEDLKKFQKRAKKMHLRLNK